MTTRVKAEAIAPPEDLEAAQALLKEIRELDLLHKATEAGLESAIAEMKERAQKGIDAMNADIEARFRAVQAYVEVNHGELIPKGRESVAWPAGTVGFRKTPLAVSITQAKFDDIVRALRQRRLSRCLRFKTEIDKDALKTVREKVEDIDGLTFKSRKEFYVKTLDAGVEHVAKVKAPKVTAKRAPAKLKKVRAAKLRLDWRLVVLALAVVAFVGLTRPAQGQTTIYCDRRADVIAFLANKSGETPAAIGVTNTGSMIELLTAGDGDTWSIISSLPDGTACLVATGWSWRPVRPRAKTEDPGT